MASDALTGFAAIVLAAGRSSRMGGANKLLLPLHGRPLVAHVFKTLSGLELDQCIVVTGRDHTDIAALAHEYGLSSLHNAGFTEGMGTSIAAGAAALAPAARGIFIHLGDLPLVDACTFHTLATAMREDAASEAEVFAPTHGQQRGHPVLFRSALLPELSALRGDTGARVVIARHAIRDVAVSDPHIARDVDTPRDFDALGNLR